MLIINTCIEEIPKGSLIYIIFMRQQQISVKMLDNIKKRIQRSYPGQALLADLGSESTKHKIKYYYELSQVRFSFVSVLGCYVFSIFQSSNLSFECSVFGSIFLARCGQRNQIERRSEIYRRQNETINSITSFLR